MRVKQIREGEVHTATTWRERLEKSKRAAAVWVREASQRELPQGMAGVEPASATEWEHGSPKPEVAAAGARVVIALQVPGVLAAVTMQIIANSCT